MRNGLMCKYISVQKRVVTKFYNAARERAERKVQGGSNMTGTNYDLFTHK